MGQFYFGDNADKWVNFKLALTVVPVYAPHYSNNYLISLSRNSHNGVALKLRYRDLAQNQYNISQIIQTLPVPVEQIYLIIDLADISVCTQDLINGVLKVCQPTASQLNWRNIIVSSTCYPSSQAGIPQHQIHLHRREEWVLWSNLISLGQWNKTPAFSDYPTTPGQFTPIDPRHMSQYVSVRYSTDTYWIFVKGTAARGNGWGQTQQLCDTLVRSPYYSGAAFSWGDQYIYDRSLGTNTSGSSKDWRKVAHTHHLTLVVSQLYNSSSTYPAI
ncbi:beta family protein [Salinivibrio kushneri]|uniref:beta family protein n=1 Tax=Salinivibrio kushneri TaxID=1908198 RepID=UPI0009D2D226|nr:beta family protein [Salinivibrio kushneri]OOE51431.1 hypothetical protein BZG12_12210 [Salinivibrio kushneri]